MSNGLFSTKQHRDYITLYFCSTFVCNCDNWQEVEEEKEKFMRP